MPSSSNKLRLTFGLGFLAFVVAGSLLLLAWLRQREREESNRLFHALAQADAEFVRRMNLPRSEKLAGDLKQLLGMQIEFREAGQGVAKGDDTLVVRLDDKNDMIFMRKPVASQLSLRDPATRNAFIAFWLVSGLVGWLLARERLKRAQSERLAMLGRVATSLAHDIKNPLASIQLHAQLMTPSDGEDAKALKMIESESEVIAGLVNQWLHLANPLPPRLVKLDVVECIAAVARNLEAQARHAAVDIENSLTRPVWVMGDAQRLSQAFRNLIVNAIQAMPRGGKLRITADGQPLTRPLPEVNQEVSESQRRGEENRFADAPTRIPSPRPNSATADNVIFGERLGEGNPKNFVTLRFTDSGPGFSESALARGTELFFTEKEGGMGVGLNIVASIVEAHGGRLELQNDPKGGAVIMVSLPAAAA
ncbi:MAG: sensor histidine kinase [Prosthecobacter sp.]|uniref:sensor histidine kinase n=1 Tax=Prosthecobacter sp. TaxID=1965333 RepID=UPI00390052BC